MGDSGGSGAVRRVIRFLFSDEEAAMALAVAIQDGA
jgi:hypothetical protein